MLRNIPHHRTSCVNHPKSLRQASGKSLLVYKEMGQNNRMESKKESGHRDDKAKSWLDVVKGNVEAKQDINCRDPESKKFYRYTIK